jgi:hypothetical protein
MVAQQTTAALGQGLNRHQGVDGDTSLSFRFFRYLTVQYGGRRQGESRRGVVGPTTRSADAVIQLLPIIAGSIEHSLEYAVIAAAITAVLILIHQSARLYFCTSRLDTAMIT